MENQRNNSGKEQEKLKSQLQNAQEKAKTAAKELKDVKSKQLILSSLSVASIIVLHLACIKQCFLHSDAVSANSNDHDEKYRRHLMCNITLRRGRLWAWCSACRDRYGPLQCAASL